MQSVPGGRALQNLEAADRFWADLCNSTSQQPAEVLTQHDKPLPHNKSAACYDIVVLGGTLGIFLATALQLRGRKVAVVERNKLVGREQEWNISRADMKVAC